MVCRDVKDDKKDKEGGRKIRHIFVTMIGKWRRKEEMSFFAIIQKVEDTASEEIIRNDFIS